MRRTLLTTLGAVVFGAHSAFAAVTVYGTWADTADARHQVVSGQPTTLKAVVRGLTAGTTYQYKWTYKSGTTDTTFSTLPAPDATGTVNVEGTYTYTGSTGATFNGSLQIYNASGVAISGATDTYLLQVAADNDTTNKKIALENALWYLHKKIRRDVTTAAGGAGQPRAWVGEGLTEWDTVLNTLIAGTAFAQVGFKANGNAANPYTDDVKRFVNYTTERLTILPIAVKGGGTSPLPAQNPENRTGGQKDSLGVAFVTADGNHQEYDFGLALRFLSICGYTTQVPTAWNPALNYANSATQINGWNYRQLAQQMVDFFAWAQLYDYGNFYLTEYDCNARDAGGKCTNFHMDICYAVDATWACSEPQVIDSPSPIVKVSFLPVASQQRGSWPYWTEGPGETWTTSGDDGSGNWTRYGVTGPVRRGSYGETSPAYWTVGGLTAAVASQSAILPASLKTELNLFLQNNQDHVGQDPISGDFRYDGEFHFGTAYGHHLVERAGQALYLLKWVGRNTTTDPQIIEAKDYINRHWGKHNYQHGQSFPSSSRGEQTCTNRNDGEPDDCYTNFGLGQIELGDFTCNAPATCASMQCTEWGCLQFNTDGTCASWDCLERSTTSCEYCDDWSPMTFTVTGHSDDLNVFGNLSVVDGLKAVGVSTGFPTPSNDPSGYDYSTRYRKLLLDNQQKTGSTRGKWEDRGWISDSVFGTAWGILLLNQL